MNTENAWQIINKSNSRFESNPKWIEEEEDLLNWAENPNFEKQPLKQIAVTFIYVSSDTSNAKLEYICTGILHTFIKLDPHEHYSILHKSDFFDKITQAKSPKTLFDDDTYKSDWLEKTYMFDNAAIYCIPIDHEQINPKSTFTQLNFSKDTVKIHCSLSVFHDLYEVVVIMREVKNVVRLKSIIKDGTKMGKTKKVRISDDSPKEFVFSKMRPVSGKRRTKKMHQ